MSLPLPPDQSSGAGPATGAPLQDLGLDSLGFPPTLTGRKPPAGASPRRPRATARRRRAARPDVRLQIRLFRRTDPIAVVGALLLVFLATNLGHLLERADEFLALRITVKNLLLLCLFGVAWRLACFVTGLYDWEKLRSRREESLRVLLTCTLVSGVALAFPAMSVTGGFRWSAVLWFWLGSTLTILGLRSLIRVLVPQAPAGVSRDVLIVGAGRRGQRLHRDLRSARAADYNVLGFVDSDAAVAPEGGKLLGGLDDLERILMHNAIDEVFIALPIKSRYTEIQRVMESCERVGVRAKHLADLFENTACVSEVEDDRVSLVAAPPAPEGWRLVAKRTIDLVGASAGLLVLSPLLLVAAAAIKLSSPGPVLFAQPRYGLNRRLFKMYKLRTMVADADALQAALEDRNEASGPVFKIRDDPRMTTVGKWLRRSSVDELPQLLNVLRGEMSLVGPRPLPTRDVHRFSEAALMRRFSVRPGLTCLWQISGRNNLTFQDWIRLDLQYIDEWSMSLDVWVLMRTLPAVVKGIGAS
jgi:exopolysaccharide biosynthesis polyprenyl glycosylphosphotransferase